VAFAADRYGGGQETGNPKRAGELASSVEENAEQTKARFLAGLAVLREQEMTNPRQIAAIGYCFEAALCVVGRARASIWRRDRLSRQLVS
jgi:dienelactone hydrolase